jgi:hypothetical protein
MSLVTQEASAEAKEEFKRALQTVFSFGSQGFQRLLEANFEFFYTFLLTPEEGAVMPSAEELGRRLQCVQGFLNSQFSRIFKDHGLHLLQGGGGSESSQRKTTSSPVESLKAIFEKAQSSEALQEKLQAFIQENSQNQDSQQPNFEKPKEDIGKLLDLCDKWEINLEDCFDEYAWGDGIAKPGNWTAEGFGSTFENSHAKMVRDQEATMREQLEGAINETRKRHLNSLQLLLKPFSFLLVDGELKSKLQENLQKFMGDNLAKEIIQQLQPQGQGSDTKAALQQELSQTLAKRQQH